MIDIEFTGTFPQVNVDLTPAMERISQLMFESVDLGFTNEGYGRWAPTRQGKPATLGKIRDTVQKSSGSDFAQLSAMNTIHQRGGSMIVTDKQRAFFWAKFYETEDDRWKWMALNKTGVMSFPVRTYLTFWEGIIEQIKDELGSQIFTTSESIQ